MKTILTIIAMFLAVSSAQLSGQQPRGKVKMIDMTDYNSTPSPHGYVGRNDGRVQQSTAGKPGGVPRGGNYSINSGMSGSGSPAQKDKGKVTAQGVKPTSSPRSSIGRNDGTLQQVTSSYVGGAGSQGKPEGGKKKGEKVSPTSSPR